MGKKTDSLGDRMKEYENISRVHTRQGVCREVVVMEGHYFRTSKLHHDKVCVRPIAHHYEEEGESPYIKYGCPVCEQFGARHSFAEGTPSCPMCGVSLLWEVVDDE